MKRKSPNFPAMVRDGGWRVVKSKTGMSGYLKIKRGVAYRITHDREHLRWVLTLDAIRVAHGDLDAMLRRADAVMNGV